jgi:hypothetical protein
VKLALFGNLNRLCLESKLFACSPPAMNCCAVKHIESLPITAILGNYESAVATGLAKYTISGDPISSVACASSFSASVRCESLLPLFAPHGCGRSGTVLFTTVDIGFDGFITFGVIVIVCISRARR